MSALSAPADGGAEIPVRQEEQVPAAMVMGFRSDCATRLKESRGRRGSIRSKPALFPADPPRFATQTQRVVADRYSAEARRGLAIAAGTSGSPAPALRAPKLPRTRLVHATDLPTAVVVLAESLTGQHPGEERLRAEARRKPGVDRDLTRRRRRDQHPPVANPGSGKTTAGQRTKPP